MYIIYIFTYKYLCIDLYIIICLSIIGSIYNMEYMIYVVGSMVDYI